MSKIGNLLATTIIVGFGQIALINPALGQAVQFGNTLAAPPTKPNTISSDRSIKVVEAEGRGRTQVQARKAAIESAVEQAVGVFIDSQRRSEMSLTNDKLHQVIEEKIQTYSSAFVERVEPLSSSLDGQDGYTVRVRAHVSVSSLLDAMREADLPIANVDMISNQTKLTTQSQMIENASSVAFARLKDVPDLFRPEIEAKSITAISNPVNNSIAALKGQIVFHTNMRKIEEFLQTYEAFQSLQQNLDSSDNPSSYQTSEISRGVSSEKKPFNFFICRSNPLGQAACRGDEINIKSIDDFNGVDIKFDLLSQNEKIGTVTSRMMLACVRPGSNSRYPGYLEAPYQDRAGGGNSPFWDAQYAIMKMSSTSAPRTSLIENRIPNFWIWAARELRNVPLTAGLVATDILDPDMTTGSSQRTGRVAAGPHGVCLQNSSFDTLRVIVPVKPGPIMRNFYLVGPREIIERVNGLQASVTLSQTRSPRR